MSIMKRLAHRYKMDEMAWFGVVIVIAAIAAWAMLIFGIHSWLPTVWMVIGGTVWLGALIFGTVGVIAICMDLWTEWRHPEWFGK